MPFLKSMDLGVGSCIADPELPSILSACAQASKPFSLNLYSDSPYTCSALRKVQREWQRIAKEVPGAEDVEMIAHGGDSELESECEWE